LKGNLLKKYVNVLMKLHFENGPVQAGVKIMSSSISESEEEVVG